MSLTNGQHKRDKHVSVTLGGGERETYSRLNTGIVRRVCGGPAQEMDAPRPTAIIGVNPVFPEDSGSSILLRRPKTTAFEVRVIICIGGVCRGWRVDGKGGKAYVCSWGIDLCSSPAALRDPPPTLPPPHWTLATFTINCFLFISTT